MGTLSMSKQVTDISNSIGKTPLVRPTPELSDLDKLRNVLDDIGIEYDTQVDEYGELLQIGVGHFSCEMQAFEFDGTGTYIG